MELRGVIKNHRGQMVFGMSYGMLFSIFLIAVFLFVAFFAIKYFLDIKKQVEVGFFVDEFQDEVTNIWNSQMGEGVWKGEISSVVEYVCFTDLVKTRTGGRYKDFVENFERYGDLDNNLFFYPGEKVDVASVKIEHINIDDIIMNDNPYCFKVENRKVEIPLSKDFDDALVKVG